MAKLLIFSHEYVALKFLKFLGSSGDIKVIDLLLAVAFGEGRYQRVNILKLYLQ
jgi:hypothetical protein